MPSRPYGTRYALDYIKEVATVPVLVLVLVLVPQYQYQYRGTGTGARFSTGVIK